ncbi:DUF5336 domain-containing protein [Streptomyces sp. L500]|uniref:DUF5336 domain-containing protein n=1 Tax=Streptomyces abikoensis TaxID=97398 RepID=UPI0016724DAC|nr:DUF5336 domain-containing protein [Streptomyces abikoensis]GGP54966.1 hypothetical protein GCM10010214_30120 [Streptomyces abikoensis]
MNIRSLTRGDGGVIGAAVLLFIASFLSFRSYDCGQATVGCPKEPIGWKPELFPVLPSIFLAGIIAAALIVAARFQPEGRKLVGLSLDQWGTAFAVFAAWSSLWTIFGGPDVEQISPGVGQILGLIANLVLAAVAVLTPRTPALKAPLMPAPQAAAPAPYGAQPPHAGYGYPGPAAGAPQPGAPSPYGAQATMPFGGPAAQPQQAQQAQPAQAQPQQQAQPAAAQPAAGQPGAPAADFAPFWFAVPVNRPLFAEDGSSNQVGELAPGTWYLAVDQRGAAIVAQTQDGRRGLLQDTTGIQRG